MAPGRRLRPQRSLVVALVAAALGAVAVAGAATAVSAPRVIGPRSTTTPRPVFRFAARGAVAFRCAFDSRRLHRCARRYSQRLAVGTHVLRVRAVGRDGRRSRVTTVRVRILQRSPALPSIPIAKTIAVGRGSGAPATGFGSVWVPNTGDGTLARVDASNGTVVTRIPYAPARPPGERGEFYDSATVAHGSVWVSSDQNGLVARVDPATNRVVATIRVGVRPAEITATTDAVWTAHFLNGFATRIDPGTGHAGEHNLPPATLTGAVGDGATVWLLSNNPQTVLHLDSAGKELGHSDVTPSSAVKRSFLQAWWLAAGEGSIWATHPNYDLVDRIDPATARVVARITVPLGRLFGVAAGRGSAWAVTDRALLRIDLATNRVVAKSELPAGSPSGFVGVSVGEGAVWVTGYDRGELYRVDA
jgi:virginiamycin B lyase